MVVAKQYQALWNFPHSLGVLMENTRCYSVKERLPVNILTTKIPSVLFSSFLQLLTTTSCVSTRGVRKNSRQRSFHEH
jgi:hypothetical protein